MIGPYLDQVNMQHRLFAELSAMFGAEVPLYDKSLEVNLVCNRAVCRLVGERFTGFAMSDAQIAATSAERHGAIRIGRPDEYRWISRFFAAFAMEPHSFYDMTALGPKSQPVIATAFRSVINPEHRVFTSLLVTDYFDEATRGRIDKALADRNVFSDRAKELIEKGEAQGGLDEAGAAALIEEATARIFKWTGCARDHGLYEDLCRAGFKIAADIACFDSHHLNHLTPNTFCMDLYTSAMKWLMGELAEDEFRTRATLALSRWAKMIDRDFLVLHFKHVERDALMAMPEREVGEDVLVVAVGDLVAALREPSLDLAEYAHNGFKDFTEGPAVEAPVLLRQDAYKALTEPVTFTNPDGSTTEAVHTARFGEIEQRFYATTVEGRAVYDQCLVNFEAQRAEDPGLAKRDFIAYQALQREAFKPLYDTLDTLLAKSLVYGKYRATAEGKAAATAGAIDTTNRSVLCDAGWLAVDGLRYEDFLPFSAAGIFASNLNQYGTASTAKERRTYVQADLEAVLGKPIVDIDLAYRGIEAQSILAGYAELGLLDRLPDGERECWEQAAKGCPVPLAPMAE